MPISELKGILKSQQLKEAVTNIIEQENLKPGECIPSENELVERYKISRTTIGKALSELVAEGVLVRVQGKGTFVTEPRHRIIKNNLDDGETDKISSKMVGLLVGTRGHLFSELYSSLIENIQSSGRLSLVVDILDKNSSYSVHKKIVELIETKPHSIIFDGQIDFPFQVLKGKENNIENLVIVNRLETKYRFQANMVLSDYIRGGYLAIKHLMKLGHKRILCIPRHYPFNKLSLDVLKWQGIQKACRDDKGVDSTAYSIALTQAPDINEKKILEIFSSPKRPTAVFAFSDSINFQVYKLLKKMGLNIPGDVALVGYFNTPWSREIDIPLTSVDINVSRIAKRAIQLVNANQKDKFETIFIEPRLIVRESSGINIGSLK